MLALVVEPRVFLVDATRTEHGAASQLGAEDTPLPAMLAFVGGAGVVRPSPEEDNAGCCIFFRGSVFR